METAGQGSDTAKTSPPEDPLSNKALSRLFFLSSSIFILSTLLLQFLMNLITAFLLKHFTISFIYSLFSIDFTFFSGTKWTLERICIVNATGYLLFFFLGMILLMIRVSNWKWKIVLAWLSFIMINGLSMALLAGIFIYDSFGVAYTWIFQNVVARAVIAIVGLAVALFFRPFWIMHFLNTAYSSKFFLDDMNRKQYISFCFILPWIAGTIVLSLFALTHLKWFWLISIIGTGLVALPIFQKEIPPLELSVDEPGKMILPGRHILICFLVILAGLWLASFIQITF